MAKFKTGFMFLLILLFLALVWYLNSAIGINLHPRSEWVTQWLTQPACELPCWENLRPGVTKMADVVSLLHKIPGAIIDSETPEIQINWQTDHTAAGGSVFADGNGLIRFMTLSFDSTQTPVSVQEVIQKYGPPTNVLIGSCMQEMSLPKKCPVDLIYQKNGMAIELYLDDSGDHTHQVKLQPDDVVLGVDLYPISGNRYPNSIGMFSAYDPDLDWDWKGYGNYP